MALTKPASVENDAFKSAKWDVITAGREFRESDASMLEQLCLWYKIAYQAENELEEFNNQTAYPTENGEIKAFPQIATLKTASGEIRQINKQLGICDSVEQEQTRKTNPTLIMVQNNRMKHKKSNVAQAAGQ